jgi:hypothetical protein
MKLLRGIYALIGIAVAFDDEKGIYRQDGLF